MVLYDDITWQGTWLSTCYCLCSETAKMQWTGNVVHTTETSHSHTSLVERSLGKRLPKDHKGDGRMIL
jgi:hypothetical protein